MERQKNMNGQWGSRVRVHPWKKITNMENLVSWGSVHKKVVHKLSLADSHCIDQFLLMQMNQLFLLLFRFPDIYGQKNFQEKNTGGEKLRHLWRRILRQKSKLGWNVEFFCLTGVEGSVLAVPSNLLRTPHLSAENFFPVDTNNLTYPGGRCKPSYPVTYNLHGWKICRELWSVRS